MPLRPYSPRDSLAIATIKATCDLTDPLALYCRHINTDQHQPQTQHAAGHKTGGREEKQWRAHVKSLQRSFELEMLMPGTVCWVVYTERHANGNEHKIRIENNARNGQSRDAGEEEGEVVVGFAIWNRHGTSPAAQKWRVPGQKVSTRLKSLMNYVSMTITYPFDSSINHAHMSQFQHRIRSAPCPFPNGQKLTLPRERWELEALYIAPEYQRQGYGMEALTWGVGVARDEKVEIWVWSSDAGKRVYEKAGFEGLGRIGFGDLLSPLLLHQEESSRNNGKEEVAVWVMRWRDREGS